MSDTMLQGFKVVELATYIAAPAAAGILADWGAQVTKIEAPAGDPMRWLRANAPGGCSPVFETNNRGKRSLALDLHSPFGQEAMRRLLATADVFVTNLRPGALKRVGLDWASVHAAYPRIVYASVTGYGLQGPAADTPAFDNAAFWARSGMAFMTRPEGAEPFSVRQGTGDHTCALATALGITTALLARERTGEGHLVEASLLRTATFVMGADLSNQARLGEVTPTHPRSSPTNPLNNFYRTGDGRWFFFMPRGIGDWPKICEVAGRSDLALDARFAAPDARLANSAELVAEFDLAFGQLTYDLLADRLKRADIVWAPVQSVEDVLGDPVARDAGCLIDVADGRGGVFQSPASPVRFNGRSGTVAEPVPTLGQHSETVLRELGLFDPRIEAESEGVKTVPSQTGY